MRVIAAGKGHYLYSVIFSKMLLLLQVHEFINIVPQF